MQKRTGSIESKVITKPRPTRHTEVKKAFMFGVSAGDTSGVEPPLRVQDECGRQR